jgi:hypothetical protein
MCRPYQVKMIISAHGSLDGFYLVRAKLLEYVSCILHLSYESPIFDLLDLEPKKECEFTHRGHLKPFGHDFSKLITKRFISRTKDNVINIYLTHK